MSELQKELDFLKFLFSKILPHLIRLALALMVVFAFNLLVRALYSEGGYFYKPRSIQDDHARKLDKYSFAGEVLPFDSPIIAKRYKKAVSRNRIKTKSNLELVKASRRWFPIIEPILKKHGVPDDFKFVIAAESRFSHVVSPRGASGFWQMMPSTARSFGLEVNAEVDERFHVVKSTEVACRLFKDSYRIFGDWMSAVLAYNVGNTALYRLKKKQKNVYVHFMRSNKETERYFFSIMAYKDLLENAAYFGYKLPSGTKTTEMKVVEVKESIKDLEQFSRQNNTTLEQLKSFNPWLLKNSLTLKPETGKKKYDLLIPVNSPEVLHSGIVSQEDSLSKKILLKDSSLAL